jgi:GTPase SAR1 family protein
MYYPNTNAILYVVDSHDKTRFVKAADELGKVLEVELR